MVPGQGYTGGRWRNGWSYGIFGSVERETTHSDQPDPARSGPFLTPRSAPFGLRYIAHITARSAMR